MAIMTKSAFVKNEWDLFYEAFRDLAGRCVANYNTMYAGTRPHFHRAFELVCVLEGEMHMTIWNEPITVYPGQTAVFEEFALHAALPTGEGRYITILIPDRYLERFRRLRGDRQLASHICLHDENELIPAACRALAAINNPALSDTETDAYRQSVIDTLLFSIARQVGFIEKPATTSERMLPIIAYVIDRLDQNLTVRQIAPRFGYTPRMLTRHFTEFAGISLKEFITINKISYAKQLLQQGVTLSKAAEKSGFGCLRTFHRVFLESEGITPGCYQMQITRK